MRASRRSTPSKAKAAPGVLLVLTGADVAADQLGAFTAGMMPEDVGAPKGHRIHQQVLQADKVRFVGDRVAFVVAETQAQARDAAEMIEVDYEPLPAVALVEDAAKDGAPKVWDDNPNGNVAFMLMFGEQGGDRRGLRQGEARREAAHGEQPAHAGVDGAAHRDRRLQRGGRCTTRSIPRRRTRTARASRSRTSSTWPRTRCAWSRPTSAAASA